MISKKKILLTLLTGILMFGVLFGYKSKEEKAIIEDYPKLQVELSTANEIIDILETEKSELKEENTELKKKIKEITKKRQEEIIQKKLKEQIKTSHIKEPIKFKINEKEIILIIDQVYLSDYRDQPGDTSIKNLIAIEYIVENKSNEQLSFNLENVANYYDSDGFKCSVYPGGECIYNLAPGKKEKGLAHIAITESEKPYLETKIAKTSYKWDLE